MSSLPIFSLDKNRIFWIIAFSLFLAFYGFTCVKKQLSSGNDFPIYYEAARKMLSSESPYDTQSGLHGYVYLPFFALLISPLTFFSLKAAAILWYLINVFLSFASIGLTGKILSRISLSAGKVPALILASLITGQFFLYNLDLGQANTALLVLTLLAVLLILEKRNDILSGILVCFASAIKPHVLLFFIPLLIRKRWKVLAGGAAGFIISIIILPLAILGPAQTKGLMADWYQKIALPIQNGTLQGSKIWDQSPQAALRRLAVDAPAFQDKKINLVSLTAKQYQTAGLMLQISLFLIFVFVWIAGKKKSARETLLGDLALSYCGMVLLVGFNLKAHFVILFLPWAFLIAELKRFQHAQLPGKSALKNLLVISALITFLSSPGILGRTISNWALAYSSITIGTLLLTTVLIVFRISWLQRRTGPEG